jgi:hypothetical protein
MSAPPDFSHPTTPTAARRKLFKANTPYAIAKSPKPNSVLVHAATVASRSATPLR